MIGNVCPALLLDTPIDRESPPHEPVMSLERPELHMIPVHPRFTSNAVSFKVCKHCGSVYVTEVE